MSSQLPIDQPSLLDVYNFRDCNNDLATGENNLYGPNIHAQYILTCSKCKDSIAYQEKGQAILDKIFHERFARHRVSLREDLLVIREVIA